MYTGMLCSMVGVTVCNCEAVSLAAGRICVQEQSSLRPKTTSSDLSDILGKRLVTLIY